MKISLRKIHKSFGTFVALENVELDIPKGELLALLGPSGSGKTTLLRIIAGLEFPDEGTQSQVVFNDEDVTYLTASKRRSGFVFQNYALFPHMTVAKNISFGLDALPRSKRPSSHEIDIKVQTLLDLIQLSKLGNRFPWQLSGGQRQRVALARALAVEPRVLLLDEPFGALDAKVRRELRTWLKAFLSKLGITSIFVTHDQEEAFAMADRVVILSEGKIRQVGSPDDIQNNPADRFVEEFIGVAGEGI